MTDRHITIGGKYNIDAPNVSPHERGSRDNTPIAKYVMVTKVKENSINRKNFKRILKRRVYGIGILTDKNEYYFNILVIRSCDLNIITATKFMKIMTTRFRYTSNTLVQLSENIKSTKEPIHTFLSIVKNLFRIQLHKTSYLQMLKSINHTYHYIVPTDPKNFKFSKRNRERMLRKLIEYDRFDFIRDPEWKYSLVDMDKPTRTANIECAVGILYMFIKDLRNKSNIAWRKRKGIE